MTALRLTVSPRNVPQREPQLARGVTKQWFVVSAEPDGASGGFIVGRVLANDADPRFGIPDVAVEVDFAVVETDAWQRPRPSIVRFCVFSSSALAVRSRPPGPRGRDRARRLREQTEG